MRKCSFRHSVDIKRQLSGPVLFFLHEFHGLRLIGFCNKWFYPLRHSNKPTIRFYFLFFSGGGGLAWCSLVWFGVIWFRLVWFDLGWVGVVWCGLVWCTWVGHEGQDHPLCLFFFRFNYFLSVNYFIYVHPKRCPLLIPPRRRGRGEPWCLFQLLSTFSCFETRSLIGPTVHSFG